MTHQNRETFYYEGEELLSYHQPLRSHPNLPKFLPLGSFCWRGYNGTWSIKKGKLYLVDLYAHVPHIREVHETQRLKYDPERDDFYYEIKREPVAVKATLEDVFPNPGDDGLFADWVTGAVNFPQGEILLKGMNKKYEQYPSLRFNQGILTGKKVLTYDNAYPLEI